MLRCSVNGVGLYESFRGLVFFCSLRSVCISSVGFMMLARHEVILISPSFHHEFALSKWQHRLLPSPRLQPCVTDLSFKASSRLADGESTLHGEPAVLEICISFN